MRISFFRSVLVLITFAFIVSSWLIVNKFSRTFTQTCHHSKTFQQGLHKLANRVHNVLNAIGLTHFLCYGSLWGQLRSSQSLPWESDIEFCLLNEEILTKDEVYLERNFRSRNMQMVYDSTEGVYTITDVAFPGGKIQLVVFEKDLVINMLRRVGWKRRVLPPDCESLPSLNCFPPRLVTPPLPLKEFGGYILPVPREGIEIQKYHYPTNWWKEILPKNC
ncbi:uncharacterized protein isoform X2 [Rhodnius prolixus]